MANYDNIAKYMPYIVDTGISVNKCTTIPASNKTKKQLKEEKEYDDVTEIVKDKPSTDKVRDFFRAWIDIKVEEKEQIMEEKINSFIK